MLPEEIFDDLDDAYKLAQQEQESINSFIASMEAHALKLITEIYGDDLLTMESEGFRQINENISRNVCRMAMDINNLVGRNQY